MILKLSLETRPVPLVADEHGVWRVAGTRIPLERILECYQAGLSPEATVEHFDALRLADVYGIISYYLDHKTEVDEYLRLSDQEADEIERTIKASQRPTITREALLARKAIREKGDVQAGR